MNDGQVSCKFEYRMAESDHLPWQARSGRVREFGPVLWPGTAPRASRGRPYSVRTAARAECTIRVAHLLTTLVRCRAVAGYAHRRFLRTVGCCSDGRETGEARYLTILRFCDSAVP